MDAWTESAPPAVPSQSQPDLTLVQYRVGHGIVVSHDCAIDKPNKNTRVLFAPVASIAKLDPAIQATVREESNLGMMHLPEVPGIGEAYADLRSMSAFPFELVAELKRVASLTDFGRTKLGDALIAFFVMRELPKRGS